MDAPETLAALRTHYLRQQAMIKHLKQTNRFLEDQLAASLEVCRLTRERSREAAARVAAEGAVPAAAAKGKRKHSLDVSDQAEDEAAQDDGDVAEAPCPLPRPTAAELEVALRSQQSGAESAPGEDPVWDSESADDDDEDRRPVFRGLSSLESFAEQDGVCCGAEPGTAPPSAGRAGLRPTTGPWCNVPTAKQRGAKEIDFTAEDPQEAQGAWLVGTVSDAELVARVAKVTCARCVAELACLCR